MAQPIVSWYEADQVTEITGLVDWGTVDADSSSPEKVFHIWNNRGGSEDVSKMEEVTITTRDRQGGLGNTPGQEVEAVRDNWFYVKVDSLGETTYTQIGSGIGLPEPLDGKKAIGTDGSTLNPKSGNKVTWIANTAYGIGDIIEPTTPNGYIYEVTQAGTSGSTEPTWSTVEGENVTDGTVMYVVVAETKTPATQEILGVANTALPDGSNVSDSEGNFATVSMYAEVPANASAGKNEFVIRVSYRYV